MKENKTITVYTNELLTIPEGGELLGVTRKTIHLWLLEDKITRIKLGRNTYLMRDEIERIKEVRDLA